MWTMQSADLMKISQDNLRGDILDIPKKQKAIGRLKELGCTHAAISVPYDTPPNAADTIMQWKEWTDVIKAAGLKTWFRPSWCSDQGWYDVPKNTGGNNRITDTVNWIKAHKDFFQNGDIFTPKPEPQNCGVIGINTGDTASARFKSVAEFNKWLRDMATACRQAFDSFGLTGVKVGYWGFDGFVVCGFGNPDWQGKTFLEKATIDAMEDGIAVDHYPPSGTTMQDFLNVFKQVWPGRNLIIGETGAKGTDPTSITNEITKTFTFLKNDPVVKAVNYWPGVGGNDGPLLSDALDPIAGFSTLQDFYKTGATPPIPTPIPTPEQKVVFGPAYKISTVTYRDLSLDGKQVGSVRMYRAKV